MDHPYSLAFCGLSSVLVYFNLPGPGNSDMASSLPRLANILDVRHEALVMVRHVADHLHPSVWQVNRVLTLQMGAKKDCIKRFPASASSRDEITNLAIFKIENNLGIFWL